MEILKIQQGTPEWHQHRLNHFNASDAPAMMGQSTYKLRSELVRQFATGIVAEVDSKIQKRFDEGHRFEALARPLAEEIVGDQLSACVCKDGRFSASMDGLTFDGLTAWEHKTINHKLRSAFDQLDAKEQSEAGLLLPDEYKIQMEHQALVSGCQRVLFMASAWDAEGNLIEERHCWYQPDDHLREQIIAGWKQFEIDVEAYKSNPTTQAPKVIAESVESLPVPVVRIDGSLTVNCNLALFSQALKDFIHNIPSPKTDQEFANAEAACKALKKAEESLSQAEDSALAHIPDIETLRRTIADLKDLARRTRLKTEKLVTAEKETRKMQLVLQAQRALEAHADVLNAELKQADAGQLPRVQNGVFAQVIKGLKSLDSMSDKLATSLVCEKSALDSLARTMRTNRDRLKTEDRDWMFLFADFDRVGMMGSTDFESIARDRIDQFTKSQEAKQQVEQEVASKSSATKAIDQTLALNEVNKRLGFNVTDQLLRSIGIQTKDDVICSTFRSICDALIRHITQVKSSF